MSWFLSHADRVWLRSRSRRHQIAAYTAIVILLALFVVFPLIAVLVDAAVTGGFGSDGPIMEWLERLSD